MEIRNSVSYVNTYGGEYKIQQTQNREFRQLVDKLTGGKIAQDFHTDKNLRYQRNLQKKREERELKERRERKERMEEALEAYAKYRRELRHYYNELGYQKRLAVSDPDAVPVGGVKRPPVVSAVYEMMMLLGM